MTDKTWMLPAVLCCVGYLCVVLDAVRRESPWQRKLVQVAWPLIWVPSGITSVIFLVPDPRDGLLVSVLAFAMIGPATILVLMVLTAAAGEYLLGRCTDVPFERMPADFKIFSISESTRARAFARGRQIRQPRAGPDPKRVRSDTRHDR